MKNFVRTFIKSTILIVAVTAFSMTLSAQENTEAYNKAKQEIIQTFGSFSFFDALINTDLLILEPSAKALKETVAATANTIVDTNVFMVYSSVLLKDRYSLSIEAYPESALFTLIT